MNMEGSQGVNGNVKPTTENAPVNLNFIGIYSNAPRQEVEEIAKKEKVGIWVTDSFTLENVSMMITNPTLFAGTEIPSKDELIELKKVLSARRVIAQ